MPTTIPLTTTLSARLPGTRSEHRRGFWTFVIATLAIYAGVVACGALIGKTAQSSQTLSVALSLDPIFKREQRSLYAPAIRLDR